MVFSVVHGGRAVALSVEGQVLIDGVSVAGRQEVGRQLEDVVSGLGAAVGAGLVECWLRRCGLFQNPGVARNSEKSILVAAARFWKTGRSAQNSEKSILATPRRFRKTRRSEEKAGKSIWVTSRRFLKTPRADENFGKLILVTVPRFLKNVRAAEKSEK